MAWTFHLLAAMLQASEELRHRFRQGRRLPGDRIVPPPRYAASLRFPSLPVLLPALALALALGVPIAALPALGEGMDAISILSLLQQNAATAPRPGQQWWHYPGRRQRERRPFVRVCLARVVLPYLREDAAVLRRAEAAGVILAAAARW